MLRQLLNLAIALPVVSAIFSDSGKWQIKINEGVAQARGGVTNNQEDWLFADDAGTDAILHIKQQDTHLDQVCKGVGAGYTGYLSLAKNTRHLYFLFVESRSKPLTDPLIHWQNGGPGCSSIAYGFLQGNGPCRINSAGTGTDHNPFAWTEHANMLYADEPAGTAFSYVTDKQVVFGSEAAANDMATLIRLLFKALPTLATLPFHLAGESNAGKHLPWLAKKLIHPEDKTIAAIQVKSLMIGNGVFDPAFQKPFQYKMACTQVNQAGTVLKPSECIQMLLDKQKCETAASIFTRSEHHTAKMDQDLFETCGQLEYRWAQNDRDYYDVRRKCPDEGGSCDPLNSVTERFLNEPAVQRAFGARVGPYRPCNDPIFDKSINSGDYFANIGPILSELLDGGLPVLIYVGVYDFLFGCAGIQAFLERLPWHGQVHYNTAREKPQAWQSGAFWQADNLVYALVSEVGHAVPEGNPEAALEMLTQWLQHQTLTPVASGAASASLKKVQGCLLANA